jgi:hypothetical protein
MVQDSHGNPISDATFVVSYAEREEKSSDVNVAAHLLVDVLTRERKRASWRASLSRAPSSALPLSVSS